jgi:hypothetical protein
VPATWTRSLDAAPRPACGVHSETGTGATGLNFLSQDYLSLSMHPDVVEAAHRTLRDHGLHSAGSGMLGGNASTAWTTRRGSGHALARAVGEGRHRGFRAANSFAGPRRAGTATAGHTLRTGLAGAAGAIPSPMQRRSICAYSPMCR